MGSGIGGRAGFAALLLVAACGGKLLPFPSSATDGASNDGGPGSEDDAASGLSSSSGSSGSTGSSSSGSSGGSTSSSSSGSSGGTRSYGGSTSSSGSPSIFSSSGGIPLPCLSVSDCPAGRICCADIDLRTGCFVGTCPSTSAGPIQLCVSASECVARGDSCTSLAIAPQDAITACRALP